MNFHTIGTAQDHGLVSVIVPTFQRYDYLRLTLHSILAQSYGNLELLVVSDGHDERTLRVVNDLGDERAKYFCTEHAGLPAVPRNEGLRQSRGRWLAFCDDDDLWYADKLMRQIPVLLDGKFSMCTTDYDYIDEHGASLKVENYYSNYYGQFSWRTFFHSMGFICNAAGLFNRETYARVGALNEEPRLKAHEDFEFWMRVLFDGDGWFMDERLVSYRIHSGSIQKHSPVQVFRNRMALHRSLRRSLPIPLKDFSRKCAKLGMHFFFDQFPFAKRQLRTTQGRNRSI